jgi:hypothetical protein
MLPTQDVADGACAPLLNAIALMDAMPRLAAPLTGPDPGVGESGKNRQDSTTWRREGTVPPTDFCQRAAYLDTSRSLA